MSGYRTNPKTDGSGIVCCIPQTGVCPVGCDDCFFQSGRSYLEPLDECLPNMPPAVMQQVVRVNDGNDSNVNPAYVVAMTNCYPMRFFNTSIAKDLDQFPAPVVLTANPGKRTDDNPQLIEPTPNLMFVRFRTNTWNLSQCTRTVDFYTSRGIPVVLTFMAYFDTADKIPPAHRGSYAFRKRTTNNYYAITPDAWRSVMDIFRDDLLAYPCGTEGVPGGFACKNCGNCLREFFATTARMEA